MFYLDDKFIGYPCKAIVEDVITRDGPADEHSFSPYDGCRHLIAEQFQGSKQGEFVLSDFLEYVSGQDFDPTRVKKSVTTAEDEIGDVSSKESAGYTTLESVGRDEDVEDYVKRLIIGYKINKNSPYKKNALNEMEYYLDDESGERTSPAELDIREHRIDLDTYMELQKKLPYLLKQLHYGSIYRGIHLISFIRAYEIVREKGKWMPQDFTACGVYKMNKDGTIGRMLNHDQDNKVVEYLPNGRRWASGEMPNDIYYKIGQELLSVLDRLGVDIKKENPLDYDCKFMDRLLCTYVSSNEEYLEQYGYVDTAIITALKPENIYRLRSVNDTAVPEVRKSFNTQAELMNINIDLLKMSNAELFNTPDLEGINMLFNETARRLGSTQPLNIHDFRSQGNLFVGKTGNYIKVDVRLCGIWDMVDAGDGKLKLPEKYAVITVSGLLVLVDDEEDYVLYISCREAASVLRGDVYARRWSAISF